MSPNRPAKKINGDKTSVGRSKIQLTTKQQKFRDVFDGNATKAAELAGYSGSYGTLAQIGRDNLRNPKIIKAIRERQNLSLSPLIATRLQRQLFWSKMMFDENEDPPNRLKASELLGRSEADFIERHKHDIGGSLMQIVAELHNKAKMGALSAGAEAAQITDDGSQGSKQGQNAITQAQTSSEVIEHDNAGNTDG